MQDIHQKMEIKKVSGKNCLARRFNSIALLFLALLWLSCNKAINDPLPPVSDGSVYPNLIQSNDGSLFMIWTNEKEKYSSIVFSEFNGRAWSDPVLIFESNSLFVNWADFPSIFHAGGDSLIVHWLQKSASGTFDYNIQLSFSTDRGKSWSNPMIVNQDGGKKGEHGFLSFFTGHNQTVGFTWLDGRQMGEYNMATHSMGDMALYQSSLKNGALTSEHILDSRVCECCPTDAVSIPEGALIAYRDRSDKEIRNIYTIRIIDGKTQKPVLVHDDNWFISGCPVNGPALSSDGEHIAVAWFTSPDKTPQVNVALSDDSGQSFQAPIQVDETLPIGRVDVEWIDDNRLFITWVRGLEVGAELCGRIVTKEGELGQVNILANMEGGRGSGYPIMTKYNDALFLAWTQPKSPTTIKTQWIHINELFF